ncbi:ABC transporter permease/M1 family aminopeptidase [Longimicrobium terrae]|uniref:ABC-type transport system involved in multi-copper enzyme maturation permease subunit n=1 Tax=Longimicrobium terrae TaxID=1639882 RepID=A0A841GUA9_9BACT|nr:M1 family aminopeptidase [Longimicrobium terrae]MBB4634597.1 ABC-type transport system involved in multi-copper enzyme maturation permease subunit [Longimicrobium terrae]MBB6068513.1 ABC-type transport system involved in multi-copper enzyme maturation permease subunit [Longimicrobium terrae]NNC27703.1 ABC transporter permease subunit [Longimicrobium terrae]
MAVLLRLAGFELRHQLRRISTWAYFAVFFALSFIMTASTAGAWQSFEMGSPVLKANSPAGIASVMAVLAIVAVPVAAGLAGRAAFRDFETGIHPLFFTTPISKGAYLGGRYLGAVAANILVLLSLPLGAAAATVMPFVEAERIGSYGLGAYLIPFVLFVIPDILLTSAIFLSLAALTRRFAAVQAGGLALLVAWSVAAVFAAALDFNWWTQLSDPFGWAPLRWSLRYWSVDERNTLPLPLTAALLRNRLLWLALAAGVMAWTIRQFRFAQFVREEGGSPPPPPSEAPSLASVLRIPRPARAFDGGARARQVAAGARAGFMRIVRGPWFWILASLCVLFMLLMATDLGSIYGTRTFPVTYQVVDLLGTSFALFLVIIIAVYAGELVWEEREVRVAGIYDSMPIPNWVPLAGKAIALTAMVAVLMGVAMLCGMIIQSVRGYFHYEPGLYLKELFGLGLSSYALLVVLAMAIHTLANHKYVGHLGVILFFILMPFAVSAGLTHNLFIYSGTPTTFYSDMNGYGHTVRAWAWYMGFWALAAVLLLLIAHLFWVRGQETDGRWRLRLARARATRPVLATALGVAALMTATGGWIVHNTVTLNEWMPEKQAERIQADYEKQYRKYLTLPQPRVTDVKLDVDLFPERRSMRIRGVYRLVNRSGRPVDQIHVDLTSSLEVERMELGVPATPFIDDDQKGYHAFRLARPLAPGDSTELRFQIAYLARGFENEPSFFPVVENGTFFDNHWLPGIGYNEEGELADESARGRYGLRERPRARPIGDSAGLARNQVSRDADWIRFAATVSTSADQTAIAPGTLVREWRQGDRRYFQYRMDVPMLSFYSFQSARYAVRRDRWRDVQIEVFHHRGHEYNVARMIRAIQKSLDYYTAQFGPYQHKQIRIVEFPRYADYAQSFAGTVPYSEGIGFIADVRADDIDYPFFVTAHEMGHQWWGHQAVPADVQGAAMLSETLAEYSALMVMEKEFGREKIGRFLRFELDGYLKGRTEERRAEMPLALVENQQYIHYNKGALVMYALRDYVGEQRVNGAIRAYLEETRFRGAPYPTSRRLVDHLRAATPDSLAYLVDDLFNNITLWDLAALSARATALPDGRYDVDVMVDAYKERSDGLGRTTPVKINDWIEVGVFGADEDEPIYLRKYRFDGQARRFRIRVDERPTRAGIDPLNKLIDRDVEDNVMDVEGLRPTLLSRPPARRASPADTARRTPVRDTSRRGSARPDSVRRDSARRDSGAARPR